jgi:hypothetical protein
MSYKRNKQNSQKGLIIRNGDSNNNNNNNDSNAFNDTLITLLFENLEHPHGLKLV